WRESQHLLEMCESNSGTGRDAHLRAPPRRAVRRGPSLSMNGASARHRLNIHEGDKIDEEALKALIHAAVALNISVRAAARPVPSQKGPKRARGASSNPGCGGNCRPSSGKGRATASQMPASIIRKPCSGILVSPQLRPQ